VKPSSATAALRLVVHGRVVRGSETLMKRLALAIALISSALLSGCIVVPAHRYYRDGGYYHGSVYVYGQSGPR